MTRKLLRMAAGGIAAVLVIGLALTAEAQPEDQKKQALALYEQGTTQYNLGRWDNAVSLFTKAYETYPAAAFLFNIGQSYRQAGDCKQALFFYRRYLSVKPDAPNKGEVDGFIRDLEESCKKQAESSRKPPTEPMDPGGGTTDDPGATDGGSSAAGDPGAATADPGAVTSDADTDASGTGTGGTEVAAVDVGGDVGGEAEVGVSAPADTLLVADRPTVLVAGVSGGFAFLGIGDLETPTQASLSISGGYPIAAGPGTLDVGAHIGYLPLPWAEGDDDGTASLTSLLANAGYSMPVASGLSVRGELGLGVLIFSGIGDGANEVFLEPDSMTTGALGMFSMRLALGAEYAITRNLSAQLYPLVLQYAPAKAGLREDIDALTSYQVLLGVGYRL